VNKTVPTANPPTGRAACRSGNSFQFPPVVSPKTSCAARPGRQLRRLAAGVGTAVALVWTHPAPAAAAGGDEPPPLHPVDGPAAVRDLRGERRVLLVLPDPQLAREWSAWSAAAAEGALDEYRLLIVVPVDPAAARALRATYALPPEAYVGLVGLDGGAKRAWRALPDPAEVFAEIERMPMRRAETRSRKPPGVSRPPRSR
jgi:hypothetical protein